MNTPVIIPTEREGVVLRELTEADDEIYQEAYASSRSEIAAFEEEAWTNYHTVDQVREKREKSKAAGDLRLGIWDGDQFVGMVSRKPSGKDMEIGYWVDSRHTGKGYATIATRAAVAFDPVSPDTIFANVVEGNDASLKVLERSGFKEVARQAGKIILNLVKD